MLNVNIDSDLVNFILPQELFYIVLECTTKSLVDISYVSRQFNQLVKTFIELKVKSIDLPLNSKWLNSKERIKSEELPIFTTKIYCEYTKIKGLKFITLVRGQFKGEKLNIHDYNKLSGKISRVNEFMATTSSKVSWVIVSRYKSLYKPQFIDTVVCTSTLQFACKELKDDKHSVLAAVRVCGEALGDASLRLRADRDVLSRNDYEC